MSVVPQVFHSGDLCGQYRIRRLIASGGIAQVYEGIHPFTGRKVAIKVLSLSHATDDVSQARMKAEAQLLTELTHPNIVTVYEANMTPEGVVWICMELVYGRTLRQWLDDEGRFEVADALYILRETAKGIAAAHELRTVHRDIKPENVMVTDRGVVKVLDFGVAKFEAFELKLTDPGRSVGTPEYMAPEQLTGGRVDFRTDIYSVGVLGYELITGSHVWLSAPEQIESHPTRSEIALWHVTRAPAPLARVIPGLPPAVGAPIEKALAKDPKARPQTMAEFARQLREARLLYLAKFPDAPTRFLEDSEQDGDRRSFLLRPGKSSEAPGSIGSRNGNRSHDSRAPRMHFPTARLTSAELGDLPLLPPRKAEPAALPEPPPTSSKTTHSAPLRFLTRSSSSEHPSKRSSMVFRVAVLIAGVTLAFAAFRYRGKIALSEPTSDSVARPSLPPMPALAPKDPPERPNIPRAVLETNQPELEAPALPSITAESQAHGTERPSTTVSQPQVVPSSPNDARSQTLRSATTSPRSSTKHGSPAALYSVDWDAIAKRAATRADEGESSDAPSPARERPKPSKASAPSGSPPNDGLVSPNPVLDKIGM